MFCHSRSDLKGDLINWDTAQFELQNMSVLERPASYMCNIFKPKSVIFPDKKSFYQLIDVCYQMKSKPTVIRSEEQLKKLGSEILEHPACTGEEHLLLKFYFSFELLFPLANVFLKYFWTGLWDEPEESVLSVPVTGEKIGAGGYAPFKLGNPRGFQLANCMKAEVNRLSFSDAFCTEKLCGFCDIAEAPKFRLRG